MKATFKHSGKIGDILYSIPTIRALGGGKLYLNINGPMLPQSSYDAVLPLLKTVPCIEEVEPYLGQDVTHDLDVPYYEARTNGDIRFKNLADIPLDYYQLDRKERNTAWIPPPAPKIIPGKPVIVNVHGRYLNKEIDWAPILNPYRNQAIYVGLRFEEWAPFVRYCGVPIPFYPTRNFYEIAQVMAGATLFIGSAGGVESVVEGLKMDKIFGVWPNNASCIFPRKGARYLER